jgi:hypothetical protein
VIGDLKYAARVSRRSPCAGRSGRAVAAARGDWDLWRDGAIGDPADAGNRNSNGAGLAFALTRIIASLLYGVKPTDVGTFIAAGLVLLVAVLLAALIPE